MDRARTSTSTSASTSWLQNETCLLAAARRHEDVLGALGVEAGLDGLAHETNALGVGLVDVDARLGRRLDERYLELARELLALLARDLAVLDEVALVGHEHEWIRLLVLHLQDAVAELAHRREALARRDAVHAQESHARADL